MANRYWVGGSGTWDATTNTNWSGTSGGTGGTVAAPTAADAVFFDGNSGTGTATIVTGALALSIDCTGYTGAIGGSGNITVSGSITLVTGMTWSHTGSLTINAASTLTSAGKTFAAITKTTAATTLTLADNLTSTGTITLTNGTLDINSKTFSAAVFSSANTNTRTLAFGASGVLSLTGTGIVFTTATGGGTFSTSGSKTVNVTSTGSTAISFLTGAITQANAVDINFTGGTYALTLGGTNRNVNFTGFAGSLNNQSRDWVGNVIFSTGMTITAGGTANTFSGTGTQVITTNGKTIDFPITHSGVGGTFRLADSLLMGSTRTFTHTNGTLDLNGNTLTVGASYTTATGTKNITFNGGFLTCPAASATAFNNAVPTNFTTTAGTGSGEIRMTAATAKTFVGGGSTFNCTLTNNGTGALTITGSNTFSALANGVSPTTFSFTAGTTTTLTNWNISGTAGNLVTIQSATAAAHTLSKASGTVSADYLSVTNSTATGGAAWYAGANSTDGGGNTGWIFSAAAAVIAVMAASEVGPDTFAASATITSAGITAAMAASEVGPDILAANAFIGYKVTAAMAASEVGPDIFAGSAFIGTPPPPVAVDIYLIKLRSFTEHRRF